MFDPSIVAYGQIFSAENVSIIMRTKKNLDSLFFDNNFSVDPLCDKIKGLGIVSSLNSDQPGHPAIIISLDCSLNG